MSNLQGQLNNKGFTLIELIVASSVSVIVLLTLVTFVSIALREFQTVSVGTTLRNEAQIAQNQVGKLIIEAVSIKKEESTAAYDVYAVDNGREELSLVYDIENRRLLIDNADSEGQTIEKIVASPEKTLLASHVSEFSLLPEEINCNEEEAAVEAKIVINIDRQSVETTQKYTLRNGMW